MRLAGTPRIVGILGALAIVGLFAYGLVSSYLDSLASVRRKDARVVWTAARLVEARLNALAIACETAVSTCRNTRSDQVECLRRRLWGMGKAHEILEADPSLAPCASKTGLCGVPVPQSFGYGSPLIGQLRIAVSDEGPSSVPLQIAFEISDILRSAANSSQQLAGISVVANDEMLASVARPGSTLDGTLLDMPRAETKSSNDADEADSREDADAALPSAHFRVAWLADGQSLRLIGHVDASRPLGRIPRRFSVFVWGGIGLLALVLCLPFLPLVAIGPAGRLSRWDVRQMALAGWTGMAAPAYLLVFSGAFSLPRAFDPTLETVAYLIRQKIGEHVNATQQIAHVAEACLHCPTLTLPKNVPGGVTISLIDQDGRIRRSWNNEWVVREEAVDQTPPDGDFSNRSYFRTARRAATHGRPAVEFVESRVTGSDRLIVARARPDGTVILVATDALVGGYMLPPGIDFAVVDDEGSVLVQSYQRSMRDLGLLGESSVATELLAAVRARSPKPRPVQGSRSGEMVDYLVVTLEPNNWVVAGERYDPGWSLILMMDRDYIEAFLGYATTRWSTSFFAYGLCVLLVHWLTSRLGNPNPAWAKLSTGEGLAYRRSTAAVCGLGLALLGTMPQAAPSQAVLASVIAAGATFMLLRSNGASDSSLAGVAVAFAGWAAAVMCFASPPQTALGWTAYLVGVGLVVWTVWDLDADHSATTPSASTARRWFATRVAAALVVVGAIPAILTARAVLHQSVAWLVRHGHAQIARSQAMAQTLEGDFKSAKVIPLDDYQLIRTQLAGTALDVHTLFWDLTTKQTFYHWQNGSDPGIVVSDTGIVLGEPCRSYETSAWERWPRGGGLARWLVASLYGQSDLASALDDVANDRFWFNGRATVARCNDVYLTAFELPKNGWKRYDWSRDGHESHLDPLAVDPGLLLVCAAWLIATVGTVYWVTGRIFPDPSPTPSPERGAPSTPPADVEPYPSELVVDPDWSYRPRPAWLGGRVVPAQGAVFVLHPDRAFSQDLGKELLETLAALREQPDTRTALVSRVDLREALESAIRSQRLLPDHAADAARELQAIRAWEQALECLDVVPPAAGRAGDADPGCTLASRLEAWAGLSPEERLVLTQVAEEGYASWRHGKPLALLAARGWLRMRPAVEFDDPELRDFVLRVRCTAEVEEMERLGASQVRSILERGIAGLAAAMLVSVYFVRPDLFKIVVPGVTTLGLALSRIVPMLSRLPLMAQAPTQETTKIV